MKEVWKDIKGYEGYYQISNFGKVRSLNRKIIYKNGRVYFYKGKILNLSNDKDGYKEAHLCNADGGRTYRVHRLVAQAFIPNPHNYPCINHKDENKQNNCMNNLEWCTVKYNNNYGNRLKEVSLHEWQPNNTSASKKVLQYSLEGKFIREWPSTMEADRNGFNSSCVANCCHFKHGTYKNYIWLYKGKDKINKKLSKSRLNKIIPHQEREIAQISKDGNLVKIWPSIQKATKFGYTGPDIIKCCRGRRHTHKGYIWKYASDVKNK